MHIPAILGMQDVRQDDMVTKRPSRRVLVLDRPVRVLCRQSEHRQGLLGTHVMPD